MSKVYVITKALPLHEEVYVGVKGSKKQAEKFIRQDFPNARIESGSTPGVTAFLCKGAYTAEDKLFGGKRDFIMFIHEEEVA